jgi:hypothetical protein
MRPLLLAVCALGVGCSFRVAAVARETPDGLVSAGDLGSVAPADLPRIDDADPTSEDLAGVDLGGVEMSTATDMTIGATDDMASLCGTLSCKSNPPGIAFCKAWCGTSTATCVNGFCAP